MTNIIIATLLLLTFIIIAIVLYVCIMIAIEPGTDKSHNQYDCDNCDYKNLCDKHNEEIGRKYCDYYE